MNEGDSPRGPVSGAGRWLLAALFTLGTAAAQDPAPQLRLDRVVPFEDPLLGAGRRFEFSLGGAGADGLVFLEAGTAADGSRGWSAQALVPAGELGTAGELRLVEYAVNAASNPEALFFRARIESRALVHHPAPGARPRYLEGVAYHVDEETGYSLEATRRRILAAPGLALANNAAWTGTLTNGAPPHAWTPFHFWPQVFDLAMIRQGDAALYDQIVAELLAAEPDRAALTASWAERLAAGHRLFIARDFVSQVRLGGAEWLEVPFALVLDLDAPEVWELQVHGRQAAGLDTIHDPRVAELREALARADDLPLGRVWSLCLRGNYRRSFHQAVVMEKLPGLAGPALQVVRMHQTCQPDGRPGPPPVFEEEEPEPPEKPGGGGGDGSGETRRRWSLARLPEVEGAGPGRSPEPPRPPEESVEDARREGPPAFPGLNQERPKIQVLLGQVDDAARQTAEDLGHDRERLTDMAYQWLDGVSFRVPCLREIYARHAGRVGELQARRAAAVAGLEACHEALRQTVRGASPPLRALLVRSNIWDQVIEVGGPWSNLALPCTFRLEPGGGLPGGSLEIVAADRFITAIARAMQRGGTWDDAVAGALNDPRNYPPPNQTVNPDSFLYAAFRNFADCLRRLYEAKFRLYLAGAYPEPGPAGREAMLGALFDGERALTPAGRAELASLILVLDDWAAKTAEGQAEVAELDREIHGVIRAEFQAEARRCYLEALDRLRGLQNMVRLLRAALVEAASPGAPGSTPAYAGGRAAFCEALRQLLSRPDIRDCPGLRAYLQSLVQANCP